MKMGSMGIAGGSDVECEEKKKRKIKEQLKIWRCHSLSIFR